MPTSDFSASSSKKSLPSTTFKSKSGAGFTLIEIVVALSLLLILTGIIFSYSRDSVQSIKLANQSAALFGLAHKTKSLSQNFKNTPPLGRQICSYGLHVDRTAKQVFIFQDMVLAASDCSLSDNAYTIGEEVSGGANLFSLEAGFSFGTSVDPLMPDLTQVVFVPPEPRVILNNSTTTVRATVIVIENANPSIRFALEISKFGQITIR